MSKSRPLYRKLAFDMSGQRHLLVCDQSAVPAEALEDGFPLERTEIWAVGAGRFRAPAALGTSLRLRLARERMGLRLYAAGTEAFLWDVASIAGQAGLGTGELYLNHIGSARRRVYCVHCKTMSENVTTNLVACAGCGITLGVRDHFSRRLAAFIGVQADAEAPGALPALEICHA